MSDFDIMRDVLREKLEIDEQYRQLATRAQAWGKRAEQAFGKNVKDIQWDKELFDILNKSIVERRDD